MKEEIIEILSGIRPNVDFTADQQLIDDGVLDSFDIISLANELMETYGVHIDAGELVPENFNTPDDIAAMVDRLLNE